MNENDIKKKKEWESRELKWDLLVILINFDQFMPFFPMDKPCNIISLFLFHRFIGEDEIRLFFAGFYSRLFFLFSERAHHAGDEREEL